MISWIKKLLGIRPQFGGTHTPKINTFPRLKALDRRVAAARNIEFDKDAM